MNLIKSDLAQIKNAESNGLMAAMSNITENVKTDLNVRLSDYFKREMPDYNGIFDESVADDILGAIKDFLIKNNIEEPPFDFPRFPEETYLLPINKNIQLKVLVVDEYYGDGFYNKYVLANFFVINKNTTEADVDTLVSFVKEYLN